MKEIVLVTLAIDVATGKNDPGAPFMVNSRIPGRSQPYQDEPGVIAQFQPGELQARFEAEWDDESGNWIFGKRVLDG
jgi:hypothetical protein